MKVNKQKFNVCLKRKYKNLSLPLPFFPNLFTNISLFFHQRIYLEKLLLNLLNHIKYRLVLIEPNVMIRNGHILECHVFGVLEERIWPPNMLPKTESNFS